MLKRERHILLITALFFLSFLLCVNGEHFVLVHGAIHGAWCWYKVANQLKLAGHNVTALDMAACGINPMQMQDLHSISEYHEPLMAFMDSLPPNEKVILVGHSLGGISVSVAMEKFPEKISVAVFITAPVLSENLTYKAIHEEIGKRMDPVDQEKPMFIIDGPNKAPKLSPFGVKTIASKLYQLSPDEDLTLAVSLVRPDFFIKDVELVTNLTAVTKEKNGRVSKVYIISEKDNTLTKDFQMWIIDRSGPFAEVKVIKDSDHMVMFSKSKKLSSELLEIANKYFLYSIYNGESIKC